MESAATESSIVAIGTPLDDREAGDLFRRGPKTIGRERRENPGRWLTQPGGMANGALRLTRGLATLMDGTSGVSRITYAYRRTGVTAPVT